ncbi:MAG TPA: methylated-DNA--[protein]-cysteine S-methyltransferase [Acidimicrobiales bacterium]|nr:methylated-DNA--[protein]-cysteine S-methyltransferase [Acidimicrobiales bacterium]
MSPVDDTQEIVARLRELGVRGRPAARPANGNTPEPYQSDVDHLVAAALAGAEAAGLVDVAWVVEDTPIGPLTLAATPAGLVSVGFGREDDVLPGLATRISPRVVHLPARFDQVRRELDEYFAGRRRHFDVALDRRLSHGYRLAVLEELSTVPFGETVSYRDLAERTGRPGASRAVGSAMATNPIPIVVPCHRVLRTGGALGGYGGGLDTKVWLLRHEGALLS